MKATLHRSRYQFIWLLAAFAACLGACDNNDEPKTIPIVSTTSTTNVTATTATGGGEITSDGNSKVSGSGLCWSSSNSIPTIADDTTRVSNATGSFTSFMKNLVPSTIYHVRAYATNGVGTGYGDVVTFTTGNSAPTASAVLVDGTVQVPETLNGSYKYDDVENDAQGSSTFKWYIANDAAGSGEVAIEGAIGLTYTIQKKDEFKFIRFGVKPIAITGSMIGEEVRSSFVGPVAEEPISITFTYNNETVNYGIIISNTTGRRWLDRNLGAPNTPSAYNDYVNQGDLFQWGRGSDGHQLTIRTPDVGNPFHGVSSPANDQVTGTLSASDSPGHNKYIIGADPVYDWRDPKNDNLWQGSSGANNPCPTGWHIPTSEEWEAENLTIDDVANYDKIKITHTGYRNGYDESISATNSFSFYWSSTVSSTLAKALVVGGGISGMEDDYRSSARACRCIKDID